MHIVQLANFYGPSSGGLRTALDAIACEYARAGHRRTLVVPGADDRVVEDHAGQVVTIRSPTVPGLGGYRAIVRRGTVDALIARERPDVIELSDKTTLVACARRARRLGIPVVLISHERLDAVFDAAVADRRAAAWAIGRYNRRLSAAVDAIVCASRFAAAEFPASPRPVHLVPLGVDTEVFRPTDRNGPARSTAPVELVAPVRLTADKQPDLLVDISRALRAGGVAHHLTVLGHGPLRAQLECDAEGLPITFTGFVADRHQLAAAMAAADIGIAPGPAETFGLAAVELMACGTPVVVPDQGSLPEIVGDGGVVAERSGQAFAAAIVAMLEGGLTNMSRRARERSLRFTWGRTASELTEIYVSLIGASATSCQPARSNL